MRMVKVLCLVMITFIVASCNAQDNKKEGQTQVKGFDDVQVYYFHMTRRCATCKAVENVSKEAVEEMNNDNVSFLAYNVEKSEGEEKAEKMNVSGQTLLITNGNKQFNITQEGFMNARSKPEKFKELIHQKVKSLQ